MTTRSESRSGMKIPRRSKILLLSEKTSSWSLSSCILVLLVCLCAIITGVSGQGDNEPCNICGPNGVVGDLFAEFNFKTCEDWKLLGESGNMNTEECNYVDLQEACECGTAAPTASPTALIDLEAQLVVVLLNVTHEMSPSIEADYEEIMASFYGTYFQEVSEWPGSVHNWIVKLDSEELLLNVTAESEGRRLERLRRRMPAQLIPLETVLNISARVTQSLGVDEFANQLKQTIVNRSEELMELLKNADSVVTSVHFLQVNETEAFGIDENMTVPWVDKDLDSGSLEPPEPPANPDEDEGLSTGSIIGIVIAGIVVLLLFMWMWYVYCGAGKTAQVEQDLEEHKKSLEESKAQRYSHATRDFGSGTRSGQVAPMDSGSGAPNASAASSRYRSQRLGPLKSSTTRIVDPEGKTVSVLSGESSRQYSASLRANQGSGVEAALPRNSASQPNSYAPSSARPVFRDEIPEGDEEEEDEDNRNDRDGLVRDDQQYNDRPEDGEESYEENTYDGSQDNYDNDHDPERQQQQQSSSPTQQERSSGSPLASEQQQAQPSSRSLNAREVVAPPGKLGIVIETTLEGPVVHKINANSPLMGKIYEGELIGAIDGIDCRAMSASAITALMVRTADSHRRMTVLSQK